jgi:hypothetical protein
LAFCSPLPVPLRPPLVSPFTYLAPSSCDRNRPPRSQVACKLTPFAPPFTQPTPSLQIPRTLTVQRLIKTTSGIFRLLLSGTLPSRGRHQVLRKSEDSSDIHLPDSANLPYRSSYSSSSLEVSLSICLSQALCLASSQSWSVAALGLFFSFCRPALIRWGRRAALLGGWRETSERKALTPSPSRLGRPAPGPTTRLLPFLLPSTHPAEAQARVRFGRHLLPHRSQPPVLASSWECCMRSPPPSLASPSRRPSRPTTPRPRPPP